MKKMLVVLMALTLVSAAGSLMVAFAGPGPAPNAGDGISDGSGLAPMPAGPGETPGPAPNSGDGFPDGPGW